MADDKTFTQADIDKAVEAAVSKIQSSVDKLETKNEELVGELRAANKELRKSKDIDPADMQRLEDENEALRSDLAKAQKEAKDATKAAETATTALETERGAARSYALDAELAGAIAEGNVVPSLVPGFKAMMAGQAKADLVDGKYSVTIGEQSARDHIKAFLDSDDGKAWRSANHNSGGGAPGGREGDPGKTVTRAAFEQMSQAERSSFATSGGKIVDEAA